MQAANLLCPVEEQYRPPGGYYDFPYIYVMPVDNVVAAGGVDPRVTLDFLNLQQRLEGDSLFVLRKITRFPIDMQDTFMVYTPQQNQRFSDPVEGRTSSVFPIVPEAIYPAGGSIYTDFHGWASSITLSFGAVGPYLFTSQTLFQGVRRFPGSNINPLPSGYDYREKPYLYRETFVLNWTYLEFVGGTYAGLNVAPPRRFVVPIQDHDFELQRISVVRTSGAGAPVVVNHLGAPYFKIMLYDQDGKRLFSEPVCVATINQSMTGNGRLFPAFPVPPIVYRANSQILYEITSLLDDVAGAGTPDSIDFQLVFQGVRRIKAGSIYGGAV